MGRAKSACLRAAETAAQQADGVAGDPSQNCPDGMLFD